MDDWIGDPIMVEMLRRTGALDEADAIFEALDEAERTGDYERVTELLGPMLSASEVRERLTELRRTPENVESPRRESALDVTRRLGHELPTDAEQQARIDREFPPATPENVDGPS